MLSRLHLLASTHTNILSVIFTLYSMYFLIFTLFFILCVVVFGVVINIRNDLALV